MAPVVCSRRAPQCPPLPSSLAHRRSRLPLRDLAGSRAFPRGVRPSRAREGAGRRRGPAFRPPGIWAGRHHLGAPLGARGRFIGAQPRGVPLLFDRASAFACGELIWSSSGSRAFAQPGPSAEGGPRWGARRPTRHGRAVSGSPIPRPYPGPRPRCFTAVALPPSRGNLGLGPDRPRNCSARAFAGVFLLADVLIVLFRRGCRAVRRFFMRHGADRGPRCVGVLFVGVRRPKSLFDATPQRGKPAPDRRAPAKLWDSPKNLLLSHAHPTGAAKADPVVPPFFHRITRPPSARRCPSDPTG